MEKDIFLRRDIDRGSPFSFYFFANLFHPLEVIVIKKKNLYFYFDCQSLSIG